MSDPFGDIPFFSELQRLLYGGGAGAGPINLVVARQVAAAASGPPGETVRKDWPRALADATRNAELVLSGYTRLVPDEPARTDVIGKNAFAISTLDAWQWLFQALGERFSGMLKQQVGDEGLSGSPFPGLDLSGAMDHFVPLMVGLQAGALVGELSKEALGRYDLPIPRDDDGRIFVVASNTEQLAEELTLDVEHLRDWLALREVGRHLVFNSAPWVSRYLKAALTDIVTSVEIDLADMERRLLELGQQGPEALQGLTVDQALPVVPTEQHARALARFQAFVAVSEGYAQNATAEVAQEMIPGAARIDEAMIRRIAAPSGGTRALTTLVGISLDRQTRLAGMTFCKAVVQLRGIEQLNQLWLAPDNLPTPEEVKDPFAWIERVLDP